jgi:uncharacterized protein
MADRFADSTAVRARDGSLLATDVYLPRTLRGRVPAILLRTPYDMRWEATLFGRLGELFADQGFAFVAQDARGRFRSGGVARPFADDASDGFDTCEWIVRQRWSDGTIGLTGDSYAGFAALATATVGHPAIRAIAIGNSTTDVMGDWTQHQGVLRLQFLVSWSLAAWSGDGLAQPDIPWGHRPLSGLVDAAAPGRSAAVLEQLVRPARDDAHGSDERAHPPFIHGVRVPALFHAGWWDLFQRGQLRDWARHRSGSGSESLLVVDPTDHDFNEWTDLPPAMRHDDSDEAASRLAEHLAPEFRFFLRHLRGRGEPPPAPVEWALTHVGSSSSPSWPPPASRPLRLHLGDAVRALRGPEGGSLGLRPDSLPTTVRWDHDPRQLVPSLQGEVAHGRFRRPDEREVQVRDDVPTFTSTPFVRPLDLCGPITAHLVVTTTGTSAHVMAKLSDVYPEGPARRIADGAALVRGGLEPTPVEVSLGHAGYRVRPGHRLRLEVASSAYPRYIWHPGTEEDPWQARDARSSPQVLHVGGNASAIELRVIETVR